MQETHKDEHKLCKNITYKMQKSNKQQKVTENCIL